MAHERTHPCLPCGDIDQSIAFYESLGFRRTYRQLRPNPYAVVALEDMHIHLFGMQGFKPTDSYGVAIVEVPDPDTLYRSFAAGLRKSLGKLPAAGIPRMTRPRKRWGTVRGFSVVDPRYKRSNAVWRAMAMRHPSNWPGPTCIEPNWRIARTIPSSRDRRSHQCSRSP
jgi:catechol 2,3-dioxygenase-like lactoylglutathione lyase family enzyme